MVITSRMLLQVMVLLQVLFQLSGAETFKLCYDRNPQCNKWPSDTLKCDDGVIELTRLQYVLEKKCCRFESDCAIDYPKITKMELMIICSNKATCEIPTEPDEDNLPDGVCDNENYKITSTKIEYTCVKDETNKALPASGSQDTTGDSGGSSAVVVPILIVLAALIIVAAIFGVVIYRRRSKRKNEENANNVTYTNRMAEDNAAVDDEYNTIPADFDEAYKALDETDAEKEKNSPNKSRDDSVKYSTIILSEETEKGSAAYGYDKTNIGKRYEVNKIKTHANDKLHCYGQVGETSDDYNKLDGKLQRHNLDKDYSHFEPESQSDYSHLNEGNKDLEHTVSDDYNHLQKHTEPIKRLGSYEKPILQTSLKENNVQPSEPKTNSKTGDYETPIKEIQCKSSLPDNTFSNKSNNKLKDDYEDPVGFRLAQVDDTLRDKEEVGQTVRDDYEEPIPFKDASLNNIDATATSPETKGSYEIPVGFRLEEVDDALRDKAEVGHTVRDDYEEPIPFKDVSLNNIDAPATSQERKGSYEIPVLKTKY